MRLYNASSRTPLTTPAIMKKQNSVPHSFVPGLQKRISSPFPNYQRKKDPYLESLSKNETHSTQSSETDGCSLGHPFRFDIDVLRSHQPQCVGTGQLDDDEFSRTSSSTITSWSTFRKDRHEKNWRPRDQASKRNEPLLPDTLAYNRKGVRPRPTRVNSMAKDECSSSISSWAAHRAHLCERYAVANFAAVSMVQEQRYSDISQVSQDNGGIGVREQHRNSNHSRSSLSASCTHSEAFKGKERACDYLAFKKDSSTLSSTTTTSDSLCGDGSLASMISKSKCRNQITQCPNTAAGLRTCIQAAGQNELSHHDDIKKANESTKLERSRLERNFSAHPVVESERDESSSHDKKSVYSPQLVLKSERDENSSYGQKSVVSAPPTNCREYRVRMMEREKVRQPATTAPGLPNPKILEILEHDGLKLSSDKELALRLLTNKHRGSEEKIVIEDSTPQIEPQRDESGQKPKKSTSQLGAPLFYIDGGLAMKTRESDNESSEDASFPKKGSRGQMREKKLVLKAHVDVSDQKSEHVMTTVREAHQKVQQADELQNVQKSHISSSSSPRSDKAEWPSPSHESTPNPHWPVSSRWSKPVTSTSHIDAVNKEDPLRIEKSWSLSPSLGESPDQQKGDRPAKLPKALVDDKQAQALLKVSEVKEWEIDDVVSADLPSPCNVAYCPVSKASSYWTTDRRVKSNDNSPLPTSGNTSSNQLNLFLTPRKLVEDTKNTQGQEIWIDNPSWEIFPSSFPHQSSAKDQSSKSSSPLSIVDTFSASSARCRADSRRNRTSDSIVCTWACQKSICESSGIESLPPGVNHFLEMHYQRAKEEMEIDEHFSKRELWQAAGCMQTETDIKKKEKSREDASPNGTLILMMFQPDQGSHGKPLASLVRRGNGQWFECDE